MEGLKKEKEDQVFEKDQSYKYVELQGLGWIICDSKMCFDFFEVQWKDEKCSTDKQYRRRYDNKRSAMITDLGLIVLQNFLPGARDIHRFVLIGHASLLADAGEASGAGDAAQGAAAEPAAKPAVIRLFDGTYSKAFYDKVRAMGEAWLQSETGGQLLIAIKERKKWDSVWMWHVSSLAIINTVLDPSAGQKRNDTKSANVSSALYSGNVAVNAGGMLTDVLVAVLRADKLRFPPSAEFATPKNGAGFIFTKSTDDDARFDCADPKQMTLTKEGPRWFWKWNGEPIMDDRGPIASEDTQSNSPQSDSPKVAWETDAIRVDHSLVPKARQEYLRYFGSIWGEQAEWFQLGMHLAEQYMQATSSADDHTPDAIIDSFRFVRNMLKYHLQRIDPEFAPTLETLEVMTKGVLMSWRNYNQWLKEKGWRPTIREFGFAIGRLILTPELPAELADTIQIISEDVVKNFPSYTDKLLKHIEQDCSAELKDKVKELIDIGSSLAS